MSSMTIKYSYVDKAGKIVIDANRYESGSKFSEGLATVEVQNKGWGFIDKNGTLVIPPQFESALSFSEGLAAVLLDDKWGFIDKNGILVIENQFDQVAHFSEGVALAQRSSEPRRSQRARPTGAEVLAESYIVEVWDLADDTNNQRAANDAESVVIDTTGQILASLDQKKLETVDDARFSEGLLSVYSPENDAHGYVDKSWEFVIQPKFSGAGPFSEGLARVAVIEDEMEKLAFIDKKGNFVIPPTFNTDYDFRRNSSNFSEGLAAVTEGLNPSRTRESTYVYIDKLGQIVLATEFFYAGEFQDGLATVYSAETNRWGFIDKTGEVVIPVEYETVNDYSG